MTASLPGTFRVDAEELGSLAGRLDGCVSEMRSAGYRMEQASVAGLGNPDLESRCSDFRDAWDYWIGKLAELTARIRAGLDHTAKAYAATDAAIEHYFTPDDSTASRSSERSQQAAYAVADDFG